MRRLWSLSWWLCHCGTLYRLQAASTGNLLTVYFSPNALSELFFVSLGPLLETYLLRCLPYEIKIKGHLKWIVQFTLRFWLHNYLILCSTTCIIVFLIQFGRLKSESKPNIPNTLTYPQQNIINKSRNINKEIRFLPILF